MLRYHSWTIIRWLLACRIMLRKASQVPTPEMRAELRGVCHFTSLADLSTAILLDAIQKPHI